ncbi:MAG TPA: methylenetetrahydrofolate reductase [Stellaceae bacterium]|nr:methylenetetrahydrofolate reductase [Stellaceae bacterium]
MIPSPSESPARSRLEARLRAGEFVVTAELTPPVATEAPLLLERGRALQGLATAVNVTDGAGAKAHLSSLVAAKLLLDAGVEPILQMTCRDRNRLALQSDLMGAMALGIRNVLVLSGDDPKAGDQPETKPVFDLDGRALLAMADRMRLERRLPTGTEIKGEVALVLGAADVPIDPPPGWDAKALAAKVAAGADFVQTQFCMDMGVARRYAARLLELGLAQRAGILIGVAPIPSARSARWMREKLFGTVIPEAIVTRLEGAVDPAREGRAICAELLQELAEIPGIAGAHVMAPQNPSAIPEVIAASGVAGSKRAT